MLEDHTSSAVRDYLFNLFAATLLTGGGNPIHNLRTRRGVVTGTHCMVITANRVGNLILHKMHYEMFKHFVKGNTNYARIVYYRVKSVPLQAWSGPEDSRKLRFQDYMTTAQDGGKVVSLMHWPLFTPQEIPPVLISVRG